MMEQFGLDRFRIARSGSLDTSTVEEKMNNSNKSDERVSVNSHFECMLQLFLITTRLQYFIPMGLLIYFYSY
jgi:hypothetical protein